MTTHTYAGYTAEQIRAAAEAATPGTWSVPEGADDIIAWVDIPIGGALNCGSIHCDHSLANARHVATAQPATVLALLDRIAELEQRVETVEGWHFTETSRADELQESIYGDRDEIADLRAQNDQMLAACRKAVLALGHAAERHPVYRRDYDALSTAIDAARPEQKNPAAP